MIVKKIRTYLLIISFSIAYGCQTSEKREEGKSKILSENKGEVAQEEPIREKNNTTIKENKNNEKIPPVHENNKTTNCQYEENMAAQGLIDIKEVDPTIQVDLKYSTNDNFVGKDVYGCLSVCYLQKKAAKMLAKANSLLKTENDSLRLHIYDGARPHAIQEVLWASLPQYPPKLRENYVANPTKGSIHNYGSAVDLTIADLDGKPLDMGTKFDFFGELAYPKLENKMFTTGKLTKQQIDNRHLLRNIMQKAGFSPIEYEWWHFNAVSREKAKLLYKIVD